MRVLITGGSGLLGQYLNEKISEENEILTLYNDNKGNCRNFNSLNADIRDWAKMSSFFNNFRPEAVVHTACYSRPEQCAKLSRDDVYLLNVEATELIAQLCNDFHAKLIYTSTDLVYDSVKGGMLSEESNLNPLTLYAESKLMGELSIQKYSDNHVILRVALLIGFGKTHSRNNFHLTYEKLKENNKVNLFRDQFRTPLSLFDAAVMINELLKMNVRNEILNFGGPERISRLEIGKAICDFCKFDSSLINDLSCKSVEGLPQVPDVSMNTDKLRSFGFNQKSFSESIRHICERRAI